MARLDFETVAFDQDHDAVEATDVRTRAGSDKRFLVERGPVDAVLALALVHHLAISNNVPLADVASFLAELTGWLIIELVSKEDEQGSDCWHPARIPSRTTTKLGSSTPMTEERIRIDESLRTQYLLRSR